MPGHVSFAPFATKAVLRCTMSRSAGSRHSCWHSITRASIDKPLRSRSLMLPYRLHHPQVVKLSGAKAEQPQFRAGQTRLFDRTVLMRETDDQVAEEPIGCETECAKADDANENLVRRHP